jgi:uncharacterized iron-regulated membrane protein
LALGLLLLLEATTGAVLLYENDIARWLHPERYRATPSATPMSAIEALTMVRASHPELGAFGVQRYQGVYLVRGGDPMGRDYLDAFVDPGTGRINGIGHELPGFVNLLINIHDAGLSGKGMPGYLPWLGTPMPSLFGEHLTVGRYLLGVLGVLMVFIAVSGAIIWWPGLNALARGFTVRPRRGNYARDLDLHRVVGIIAVPFLLMWGVTGAAMFFEWPGRAYFALVPGHRLSTPAPPTVGTGPMLTLDQARDRALAAHPGAEVIAIGAQRPEQRGGAYRFRLRAGYDPYEYWNFSGNLYLSVDSHGGGTQDWVPHEPSAPLSQRLWNNGIYDGLHFGTVVGPLPRLVWLLFGLTPVLLGVTGVTVWLTKSRSARRRRQRHRRTRS